MGKLEGKIAVVTGGNSGIGLATAEAFVVEGAHVFVTGRRQAELNAAVAHIGSNATAVQGAVSKPEDLDRLYRQVKHEKGKLDVLFANAGIGPRARLGEITDKHIDDLLSINIKGVILTVQKALRTALVKVDARRPRTLIVPFPQRGKRGIYQEGKVWVQTDAGAMVEELPAPRTAYEGHERHTPWNDLQYLYFIGYAFWNYFTTPFLLASEGVTCEEIEPWQENHQKWRVLRATFDSSIDTHCAVQKFYFDDHGMLQRRDYFTDVAKGNVTHYCMDYRTFDGFVFPTRRRVVSRGDGEFTTTSGPSSVLIDIESVVVNRD